MKIRILAMMAATAFIMSVCACSSDKNEPEVALAVQVAGAYTGNQVITVMGDESSNETVTFNFSKASDFTIDMTIPASGEGMMAMPALPVKSITLTKSGNGIVGKLASYSGTVTNAQGSEKAYTVNDITAIFNDKAVVVAFTVKYGNMPFDMISNFTGTK